jgi:hypothetical protein
MLAMRTISENFFGREGGWVVEEWSGEVALGFARLRIRWEDGVNSWLLG